MFLRLNRISIYHSVLVGTKDEGAIVYAWYYRNSHLGYKPALTDSYREFWL